MESTKVILRHCATYDPEQIALILEEGMDELGVQPHGRTMVKPNVVMAHSRFIRHAYTRPEFVDGLLTATKRRGSQISRLSVGERSGITVPTRYFFANAGYPKMLRKQRVPADYFDEGAQVPVSLKHPDALREMIMVPDAVANCDFLINAPKLKAHPWTKFTCALKNYIGIQDDAHRLIDHDHMLHTKIADLQEVISPGFIAVDAILAGERTMTVPKPFSVELIIMGVNPVAVDAVCAHILGLDPQEVDHVRICSQRGYGPIDLQEIEITGDVNLAEAQKRARGLELTLDRVDQILNDKTNVTAHVGPPPDTYDYCWGGCPGSLFESMEILDVFQEGVYRKIRPLHIVIGAYQGDIDAAPGEPVLFVGDCTTWRGEIGGEMIDIPSTYVERQHLNPLKAASGDIVKKMVQVGLNLWQHRGRPILRVRGCPVSIAEVVLYLSSKGKVINPYLHREVVFEFSFYWAVVKMMQFRNALGGRSRRPTG